MLIEQEIPKYRKSTDSNISKSNRKSKHKHQYEECLIQYDFPYNDRTNTTTRLSSYCTICGKIGGKFKEDKSIVKDYERFTYIPSIGKCHSFITSKELYDKYHNVLPVFHIEDMFDKYVDLNENDDLMENK